MKRFLLILFLALAVPVTQARADIAANAGRDVYTGNASTTAFAYTFKLLTASDISVYVNGTLQTLITHYTLSGVLNDNGGTVTFVSAPAQDAQVLFLRNQTIEQASSYSTGAVSPSQIERDFDRQTAVNQQQQEEINRSLRFPRTTTPNSTLTTLPTPSANKCIGWNATATGTDNLDCAGGGGSALPSGSDTQVQFNDGGTVFGGDAGLVFNKTSNVLTVTGDVVVGAQSVCLEDGTNCPAGSGDDQTAAEVPSTPAGNLAATDVQTALNELDTEKQPIDSDLTAVAGLSTTGLVARTGPGAAAARTITGTTEQVTVVQGDAVAGNPQLSIPATLTIPGTVQVTGVSPAQITADQNDYTLASGVFQRFSTDAARTITGFTAPSGFRFIVLANVGSQNLIVAHQSTSSTASNRVISVTGASLTIPPNSLASMFYDLTSTRWRAYEVGGDILTAVKADADIVALFQGSQWYCAGVGATDAQTCNTTRTYAAYVTGSWIDFVSATINTGAATVNVNSLGVKTIVQHDGSTLTDGLIQAGRPYRLTYDGTNFRMPPGGTGGAGTLTGTGTAGKLPLWTDTTVLGNSGLADDGAGTFTYGDCGTNCLTEDRSLITGAKTHTYPNATGTIALTSDITGGDLTEVAVTAPIEVSTGTGPIPNIACSTCETTTGAQTKVDTHVNDTTAAHAGSAISVDSTNLVGTGTDVQAVLEELDNGIADHLADTTGAHAASAISVSSTNLDGTGTDVQTVLEELENQMDINVKSIWFGAGSLSTDGTQCAAPAEVTINSGPKLWTIICTDNDASTIHGSVMMPDSWDGGTVTFTHSYIQTAADTGVLNGDIACQARSDGEVPSSTYGTEVALDDAAVVGSNANDQTTSAAATCAGTGVGGGDMLYFRYQLDATGTTTAVATLHHLGFMVKYSTLSRSD